MRPQLKKNIISDTEFTVLKYLYKRCETNKKQPQADIFQIASETSIKDKEDVIRALYVLEGRSLVTSHPENNFTSNIWKITETGIKAFTLAMQM